MKILRSFISINLVIIFFFGSLFSLSSNPVYYTNSAKYHIVMKGDTLNKISQDYNISINDIKLFNNLITDKIIIGQKLYLTPVKTDKHEYVTQRKIPNEGYYISKKGDTLNRVSKMYGISIIDIIDYNNLSEFKLETGYKVFLTASKKEKQQIKKTKEVVLSQPSKQVKKKVSTEQHTQKNLKAKDTSLFCPCTGQVTSRFGMRNGKPHKGIDIAAPSGTPIYAIQRGSVVFSGRQRGYGNVIILEHDNYVMTVYAHNESNLVRLGDNVDKGQPIGTVGNSGTSSGSHLHFEYRVQGKAIDPVQVLSCLK